MQQYDLVAEILPELEEAYKASVCDYQGVFAGKSQKHSSKKRWSEAISIWVPIPNAVLKDSADDIETVCRKLADSKFVESAEAVSGTAFTDRNRLAVIPDAVYVHVVCVPFRDLAIA